MRDDYYEFEKFQAEHEEELKTKFLQLRSSEFDVFCYEEYLEFKRGIDDFVYDMMKEDGYLSDLLYDKED